jgi:hypothetical protein
MTITLNHSNPLLVLRCQTRLCVSLPSLPTYLHLISATLPPRPSHHHHLPTTQHQIQTHRHSLLHVVPRKATRPRTERRPRLGNRPKGRIRLFFSEHGEVPQNHPPDSPWTASSETFAARLEERRGFRTRFEALDWVSCGYFLCDED